jgi:hypothetical protein
MPYIVWENLGEAEMRLLALAAIALLASPAPAPAEGSWDNRLVERLAWPEMSTFESERDYRRWIRNIRDMQRKLREARRASLPNEIVVAQVDIGEVECNPLYADCFDQDSGEGTIMVTGSRITSSPQSSTTAVTSITNNQTANVDEGDIVKRIGDYLLVLQDGRIFAANFRTMQLTDRIDVYRQDEDGDPIGADWYDEMLVQGDHILITAYSYYEDASEISVFRLDQSSGRIERQGVFLISSEDYYDIDNYATRVVGDKLVIYTPYSPEDLVNRRNRPTVRRWSAADDFDARAGDAILDPEDIYRPVFGTFDPTVHTISICDLGALDNNELDCESTAFIAGDHAEMFVSPDNIFLSTTAVSWRDDNTWSVCRARKAGVQAGDGPPPGAVFRIPLHGRQEPDLLSVRGVVFDQFSMDQQGSRFRMVTSWPEFTCGENWWDSGSNQGPIELVDTTIGTFTTSYRKAPDRRFTPLPEVAEGAFENRFIGEWLLYGSRSRWGRPPDPEDGEVLSGLEVVAVPLGSPERSTRIPLQHEITRIEAIAGDALLTGYRDDLGLRLSFVDLDRSASVAGTAYLEGRYESEGRSHAFNSIIYPEGEGLMGLPTVRAEEDSGRRWWRSDESSISFLRFTNEGRLIDLSDVPPGENAGKEAEGYRCEVSCVDWYGNSRPIFIDRGVYALMGTELVEGRAMPDRVEVMRRLDLTAKVAP